MTSINSSSIKKFLAIFAGLFLILSVPGLILSWGKWHYYNQEYSSALSYFDTSEWFSIFKFDHLFAKGSSYYWMKDYNRAIEQFTEAASEGMTGKENELANYNLGNAYYRLAEEKMNNQEEGVRENLLAAIDAYTRALEINPDNREAFENRELARKRLEEIEKNSRQKESEDGEESEDKKQDENQETDPEEEEKIKESLEQQKEAEEEGRKKYNDRKYFDEGFPPKVEGW
jgi:Ca-activated chloride channel family protein